MVKTHSVSSLVFTLDKNFIHILHKKVKDWITVPINMIINKDGESHILLDSQMLVRCFLEIMSVFEWWESAKNKNTKHF